MEYSQISLKYNNRSSAEFGAFLLYPFNLVHAKRDLSGTSIPAVNGDYIIDNLKYTNVVQQLTFFVQRPLQCETWERLEMAFLDWLTPQTEYREYEPFYIDFLDPYHWLGFLSETPAWTIQTSTTAQVTVTLSCKPYVRYYDSEFIRVPSTVVNTETIPAQPIFHIVGTGDISLKINGLTYQLNPVDDEVFIDCENFLVYKSLTQPRGTIAKFPNNDFPVLKTGENKISITGKVTKFEYKPNWRRLL